MIGSPDDTSNVNEPARSNTIGSEARGLASQVVDRAKGLAHERVDDRQTESAGQIERIARALHQTSEDMDGRASAHYVEKAAEMLDRVSDSIRTANFRDAVDATERFARREPLLFLGGAFALGVLAARFLKSSKRDADAEVMDEAPPAGGV